MSTLGPSSSLHQDRPCSSPHSIFLSSTNTTGAQPTMLPQKGQEKKMSFSNFSNLPAEIRVKIWEFALPGWRVISILPSNDASTFTSTSAKHESSPTFTKQSRFERHDMYQNWYQKAAELTYHALATHTLNALSRTCRASREVLLGRYRLILNEHFKPNSEREERGQGIWIHPHIDTLFICPLATQSFLQKIASRKEMSAQTYLDLGKVLNLAIQAPINVWRNGGGGEGGVVIEFDKLAAKKGYELIGAFSRLRRVVFVLGGGMGEGDEDCAKEEKEGEVDEVEADEDWLVESFKNGHKLEGDEFLWKFFDKGLLTGLEFEVLKRSEIEDWVEGGDGLGVDVEGGKRMEVEDDEEDEYEEEKEEGEEEESGWYC